MERRVDECLLWLFAIPCCDRTCMWELSTEDFSFYELHLRNLNQTEKRNYLIGCLSNHWQPCNLGEFITEFFAKGESISRKAWLLIHNVNREWFRKIFINFKQGSVKVEHGNLSQKKPPQKPTDCIVWLHFLVSCVSQYQPDNKTIHLPPCFTQLSMSQRTCEENTLSSTLSPLFTCPYSKGVPTVWYTRHNRIDKTLWNIILFRHRSMSQGNNVRYACAPLRSVAC